MSEFEDIDKELEEFSKSTRKVRTIYGEQFEFPRVGWVVEAKILRSLGKLLKRIPAIFYQLPGLEEAKEQDILNVLGNLTGQNILEAVSIICEEAPEEITKMVSLITKQEETWVGENLDLEGIAEVLLPFFYERKLKITRLIQQWTPKNSSLPKESSQPQ